ncbi:molecular chaperone [Sphingobium sp. BYY-5]|uniref:fimbrial biogenesis chaperone n=1 Tax=Sphingobium sp. BYY-5 TaxID=2926400 RepID=UPI001FA6C7FF|nr:molecular chaperone [Sphingobium sp. BYY-5]MCI4590292.1 molecular chaperone [Sphingobium sp. BYY-5]
MPLSPLRSGMIAIAVWTILSGLAHAQTTNSVVIWPINPVIESGERATALRLENPGKRPILMQIRVFGWQQAEGEDRYGEQKDVTGTPPMVRIEPGQRQLIRLTRITPPPAGREQAYRIIIDEIPLADTPVETAKTSGTGGQAGAAIQFRMRYSLPLFLYGDGIGSRPPKGQVAAKAALQWRVIDANGKSVLEIRNGNTTHSRLSQVSLKRADGTLSKLDGVHGYILPDAVMRWPIGLSISPRATLVAANGDQPVSLTPWDP